MKGCPQAADACESAASAQAFCCVAQLIRYRNYIIQHPRARNLLGDNISTTTNETSSRSLRRPRAVAAERISRVTCQRSSSTTPVGVRGTAHSSEARQAHPGAFPRLRNLKLPYRGSALPLGKCGGGMSGYQARAESAESTSACHLPARAEKKLESAYHAESVLGLVLRADKCALVTRECVEIDVLRLSPA